MTNSATHALIASEIASSGLFDEEWYSANNPDVVEAGLGALDHFILYGSSEGRSASPFFLTHYYNSQLDPFAKSDNAIIHYIRIGEASGLKPNPLFDPSYYRRLTGVSVQCPETLLAHHINLGGGVRPHPDIDPNVYGAAVERSQADEHPLSLLLHETGYHDPPDPIDAATEASPGNAVFTPRRARWRFDALTLLPQHSDVLLLAMYSRDGRISDVQRNLVKFYTTLGYQVALAINTENNIRLVSTDEALAKIVIVRENLGFDISAWGDLASSLKETLIGARSVTFTNDSIIPEPNSFAKYRQKIAADSSAGIIFASRNYQFQSHCQSYFFTACGRKSIEAALAVIQDAPSFSEKQQLIEQFEIRLEQFLAVRGAKVSAAYDPGPLEDSSGRLLNPTIEGWRELCEAGHPFVKVALFAEENNHEPLSALFGPEAIEDVRSHLETRSIAASRPPAHVFETDWRNSFEDGSVRNSIGARNAVNPPDWLDLAVFPEGERELKKPPRVLCMIHCYYLDEALSILDLMEAAGSDFRYLLTSPHAEDIRTLEGALESRTLSGEVVQCPNRGRNVAPFLVETPLRADDAELILHLHTKKSPHNELYTGWGKHLRDNLVGDRDHVSAIMGLFRTPELGLVYSSHFNPVADLRNWGFDFPAAKRTLERLGVHIEADTPLEFPTSTMFWARPSALRKLWDLNLDYEDFEEEAGQIDGTLAHSIERILCYLAEDAGLKFCAVSNPNAADKPVAIRSADFTKINALRPLRLLGNHNRLRGLDISELYEARFVDSASLRPRINLVVPTLDPHKAYGGITSAIESFKALISELAGDFDVRVLSATDEIGSAEQTFAARVFGQPLVCVSASDDWSQVWTVVPRSEIASRPVSLRRNDVFFATAWWTADLALRLKDMQDCCFGSSPPLVYLIQDFEPGFYPFSDRYLLAKNTYSPTADLISIINSEELYDFFKEKFPDRASFCLPYRINPDIEANLVDDLPRDLLLAYARPGTPRNLYRILLAGLKQWRTRDEEALDYKIVLAGEPVQEGDLEGLDNVEAVGKMSVADYADTLSRTAIGISFMASPHPSYPPLEMAQAGCITITNAFENKDLTLRSDNFISLEEVSPEAVRRAINHAVMRDREGLQPKTALASPPGERRLINWGLIARTIRKSLRDEAS